MSGQFPKYKDWREDGRVKLPKSLYPAVIADYARLKSSRAVGKIYGVNKKIILFIVNPELKARDSQRQKEQQHWKIYYKKEYHTRAIRKYRAKKRTLGYKQKRNCKGGDNL